MLALGWLSLLAAQGQGKPPAAPHPPWPLISGCQTRGDQLPSGMAVKHCEQRLPQLGSGITGSNLRVGLAPLPALRSLPQPLPALKSHWQTQLSPQDRGFMVKPQLPETGDGVAFLSLSPPAPALEGAEREHEALSRTLNAVF